MCNRRQQAARIELEVDDRHEFEHHERFGLKVVSAGSMAMP